jgi:hypothetical protein
MMTRKKDRKHSCCSAQLYTDCRSQVTGQSWLDALIIALFNCVLGDWRFAWEMANVGRLQSRPCYKVLVRAKRTCSLESAGARSMMVP